MELSIITQSDVRGKAADLADYHRLRHDIFVSLAGLGRKDLYAAAGLETDIWDLSFFNPVHFLVRHDGKPAAVGRMTSSQYPTMMDAHYGEFIAGPAPRDPKLWEVQRLGVDLSLDKWTREKALMTLLVGMLRWCQREGVDRVMLLTFEGIAKKRLRRMARMGPTGLHLGFPHVALIGDIDADGVADFEAQLAALDAPERRVA